MGSVANAIFINDLRKHHTSEFLCPLGTEKYNIKYSVISVTLWQRSACKLAVNTQAAPYNPAVPAGAKLRFYPAGAERQ